MTDSPDRTPDAESHLPLNSRDFQLLLLCFDEPMHGYGIVKAAAESGSSVLDLGSLYRIIARLTKDGLLEDVSQERGDSKRQRRYYRATELGRRVARAEAARLRTLLESERAELLWEKP
jgi:DNA-binding PadR family transcriptional regulator